MIPVRKIDVAQPSHFSEFVDFDFAFKKSIKTAHFQLRHSFNRCVIASVFFVVS